MINNEKSSQKLFGQLIGKLGLKPSVWMSSFIDKLSSNASVTEIPPIINVYLFSEWNIVLSISTGVMATPEKPEDVSAAAVVAVVTEEDEILAKASNGLNIDEEFIRLNQNLYRYMNRQLSFASIERVDRIVF